MQPKRTGIARRTMLGGIGAGVLLGTVGSVGIAAAAGRRGGGGISPEEIAALNTAITDEYEARDTYQAMIAKFGPILPFSSTVSAEEQHISALANLFTRYGLEVPSDPYVADPEHYAPPLIPDTRVECCQLGVDVETANVAMYDELLKTVSKPSIVKVFTSLQSASEDKHLPAFGAVPPDSATAPRAAQSPACPSFVP